jgi:hypothetical protein
MMLRNVCADVAGVDLVLQQEVADDGKRGLQEGAAVSVKLLRDNEGCHFRANEVRVEVDIWEMPSGAGRPFEGGCRCSSN